jgi:hypothetical protein
LLAGAAATSYPVRFGVVEHVHVMVADYTIGALSAIHPALESQTGVHFDFARTSWRLGDGKANTEDRTKLYATLLRCDGNR